TPSCIESCTIFGGRFDVKPNRVLVCPFGIVLPKFAPNTVGCVTRLVGATLPRPPKLVGAPLLDHGENDPGGDDGDAGVPNGCAAVMAPPASTNPKVTPKIPDPVAWAWSHTIVMRPIASLELFDTWKRYKNDEAVLKPAAVRAASMAVPVPNESPATPPVRM